MPVTPVTLTATRAAIQEGAGDVGASLVEHIGAIEAALSGNDADTAATHIVGMIPVMHDERLSVAAAASIWDALFAELRIGAADSMVPKITFTDHPGMRCNHAAGAAGRCDIPDAASNCQEIFEGGAHKGCRPKP